MEKYREGQRNLHCIRGPGESLRQGSERRAVVKSEMAEKYVQLVQDMYEGSETVVRYAVRTTESFKVKVELHSTLSPFVFALIMDRLTDKVRREPP